MPMASLRTPWPRTRLKPSLAVADLVVRLQIRPQRQAGRARADGGRPEVRVPRGLLRRVHRDRVVGRARLPAACQAHNRQRKNREELPRAAGMQRAEPAWSP